MMGAQQTMALILPAVRGRRRLLIACILLSPACVDGRVPSPLSDGPPARDDSPVQTDSVVYHLQRRASEYRAYVSATFTNRTASPVYFARCNPESTTPMFGIGRTGADSTKAFFSDIAWACVGGVPTGKIVPGGSAAVRIPIGSVDQPAMQPPLTPEQLVGLLRVNLLLCRRYSEDSDFCDAMPEAQRISNAFLVTY